MQAAVWRHLAEDDIALYLNGHLELRRIPAVEAHLSDCPACKDKLDQTLHLITKLADLGSRQRGFPLLESGLEKRREPRFATDSTMGLQVLRPLSFERLTGRVVNVSRSGVALRLARPLERGSLIQVRVGNTVLLGEVRHCAKIDNEFAIGVLLEDIAES